MSEKHEIDWPAVHRQLEHGTQLLETAFTPPPEQVRRVLAERAEALARRQNRTTAAAEAATAQTARRSVLLVEVGSHIAGIEIHWVREVLHLPQGHAPVPDAHALLLGVVNVHSQIVNLVSPWPLLNEAAPSAAGTPAAFPQAVLLRHPHLNVAIGCTAVRSLVELPPEAWQDERLFLPGDDQRPAVLMDVAALLGPWEKAT
ncbi:MAG: chemotaxis protein CheW [Prosthecobacter sp.]